MLQRFRGELTLLDSRGGQADAKLLPRQERTGLSFGRASGGDRRPELPGGGEGPIDDDIPF